MNPTIDNYYYIPTPLTDSSGLPIMRCIPKMETNVIALSTMGNTTKVVYRPACIAPGVDTHFVHMLSVCSAISYQKRMNRRQGVVEYRSPQYCKKGEDMPRKPLYWLFTSLL